MIVASATKMEVIMDRLMKSVNRTHRCFNKYHAEKLKDYGVGGHQMMYIVRICHHPGIKQDLLSKHISVNKSNVTRQLASLEQNGFIERKPSLEDKRSILVYPTQKALDVCPIIEKMHSEWNDLILEDFSEEEKELLMKMMQQVQHKAMELVREVEEDEG